MQTINTVDDYIAQFPEEMQEKLRELRATIKAIAPGAQERISYSMPFYEYKGRLVYFQLWKKYIGLYIPPPIVEEHASDLAGYQTTKSAIHLPLDKQLPLDLVKTLVQARMRWNDETEKGKSHST